MSSIKSKKPWHQMTMQEPDAIREWRKYANAENAKVLKRSRWYKP